MTARKQRLTVTVDPELVAAGTRAVESGAATSLSAWVSLAMADRAHREEQLAHLRRAIAEYEDEFGAVSAAEIAAVQRTDRAAARVVRGRRAGKTASA